MTTAPTAADNMDTMARVSTQPISPEVSETTAKNNYQPSLPEVSEPTDSNPNGFLLCSWSRFYCLTAVSLLPQKDARARA